jgi:hypothetical protein
MIRALLVFLTADIEALGGPHPPMAWVTLILVIGTVILMTICLPVYADKLITLEKEESVEEQQNLQRNEGQAPGENHDESSFREATAREDRLLFSGSLGISLLAIIQFLQLHHLNTALSVSLHCFALSIPLSAMGVVVTEVELARKNHIVRLRHLFLIAGWTGLATAICGVVGLFLHLGAIGECRRQGDMALLFQFRRYPP